MPTKNPRINVVVDEPLYRQVQSLAKRDGVSLSLKARDLIREAMEILEDEALVAVAEKRDATWSRSKALKHDQVW